MHIPEATSKPCRKPASTVSVPNGVEFSFSTQLTARSTRRPRQCVALDPRAAPLLHAKLLSDIRSYYSFLEDS